MSDSRNRERRSWSFAGGQACRPDQDLPVVIGCGGALPSTHEPDPLPADPNAGRIPVSEEVVETSDPVPVNARRLLKAEKLW